jgi:hypothetical protein
LIQGETRTLYSTISAVTALPAAQLATLVPFWCEYSSSQRFELTGPAALTTMMPDLAACGRVRLSEWLGI